MATVPDPVAEAGEVVVDVAATAVNRADLAQRVGNYPPPPGASEILGLEAAGTIRALGPGVSGWNPGDRVMALLAGGGYAEQVAVPAGQLLPVPAGMDLVSAAAIPEVFTTAWMALSHRAGLRAGEHLLVHAAASGVGTAAVQMAREMGAGVVAASRDADRLDAARGLGADHGVVTADGVFAEAVHDLLPRGVDVVLDLVGPGWWDENVSCLAPGGRIVTLSLLTGRTVPVDFARLMSRQATLHVAGLRLTDAVLKAELVRGFGQWGLSRLADRRLRPVIAQVLPLAEAGAAHALLEETPVTGKIVLEVTR